MTVYPSILDLVGNTPIVDVSTLSPNPKVRILAKLEGQNPGGSVKDRIAKSMILEAEADGSLTPGKTIIEPSSGNTGIGLAMIAKMRGYKIKIVLPENVSMITEHTESVQTTYVSGTGDYTAAPTFPATTLNAFYVVTGVEVTAPPQARAVVTLGDSLTVGFGSTPDANRRWTDLLAERLQSGPGTKHVAVVNAGVVGNRLLHDFVGTSALARLDRDVLVQSGAQYMIVLEGNADLLIPPLINNPSEVVTIGQILQAYRQLIDRGHALGLSVYGATLNPVEGYPFPGLWTAELEQKRQDINRWIRTSGAFDAVIDFDQVLRDPTNPASLLSRYDSGDHVHPNDLGYQAMADAVNLSLFRGVDQD